jgi:hypothetical protein
MFLFKGSEDHGDLGDLGGEVLALPAVSDFFGFDSFANVLPPEPNPHPEYRRPVFA